MRKYYTVIIYLFIFAGYCYPQNYNVHGYVVDSSDNKSLINAQVMIKNSKAGTLCNQSGWFSLNIQSSDILVISFVGYYPKELMCNDMITQEMPIRIKLTERPIISKEVVVETDKKRSKEYQQTGYLQLSTQEIRYLPAVGGESDITKTMQLLPGITSTNEGSSRMNVRGGNDDQNLILIDGVQIYNPVHFLAYLSSFNTDAIAGVELMKGYIPAEYSGKLSSVMSVALKEGNPKEHKISGGISFLSSQLYFEGPMSKKITYMLSARRTYLDPLFALIDADGLGYSFHDIYGKLTMNITSNDRLYFCMYNGLDKYINESNSGNDPDWVNDWGNTVAHLRYNKIWNPSLFSDISLIYSDYHFSQNYGDIHKEPSLKQITLKTLSDYKYSEDISVRFGADFSRYYFTVTSGLQNYQNAVGYKLNSTEANIFGTLKKKFDENLNADFGIALSVFNESKTKKSYYFVEPRACLTYFLDDDISLKLAYTRMHQYVHMLSSNRFYLPTDIFYPSFDDLKPMSGSQTSLGMNKELTLFGTKFETSFDVYYKDMRDVPQFKQNFSNADPASLPSQLLFGRGWGYGMELQIAKREGGTTGWINYTWNKVNRMVKGKNHDKPYVPKFFREHQLNIVFNQNISSKLQFNANFIIASGQHITLPVSEYFILTDNMSDIGSGGFDSNSGYIDHGELNSYKLPLYNRLDLSIVHFFTMWGGNWELFASAYNVYNYPNPTFLWYSIAANKFYRTTVGILPTFGLRFNY